MSVPDDYPHGGCGTDAADDFYAITPSDTVDLTKRPRGIWVGVAGDVAVRAKDNSTVVVFKNCPAGSTLPARTNRVMATNTTATNLVALL
jgi:hypothetical protein